MNKHQIRKEIQAFADDDANILFDASGNLLFTKNGKDYICQITTEIDTGITRVACEGKNYLFREFISKELARLDVFAQKIIDKRQQIDPYVDGQGVLKTAFTEKSDTCLNLLLDECKNFYEFSTKVTFVTADAGHGKTALLKQFQFAQAKRYLLKESNFLFWHVDLQGRDLVRLPEAIMYDLAELRISGLFYSSIINLIKNKYIILAIDGFDELAAEIGGTSALGALSSLVAEMEGQGTLVAASRRTFFDTQDYLKRTNFLKTKLSPDCEFNELKLKNWEQSSSIEYLSYFFDDAQTTYNDILKELNNQAEHPILTRPFLLAKTAQGLLDSNYSPANFFNIINNSEEGVALVVEAFTRREVDKWKERDKQTGKPYLDFQQHIQLLATVAKEMWEYQRDNMTKDEIQLYTTMLLEEWQIEASIKPVIIRLVESHAFLIPASDTRPELRKFEHEEFKNYFIARALATIINQSIKEKTESSISELNKFLYYNQLPDSVARYCFNYIDCLQENAEDLIKIFTEIIEEEWKPTYLQTNIGTLIPFILDKRLACSKTLSLSMKVNYTSIIFENKILESLKFISGNFINISFRHTKLVNITFKNCTFNQIRLETDSPLKFENVVMDHSEISSIFLIKNDEIIETAYSPIRIKQILERLGFTIINGEISTNPNLVESEFKKLVLRFLTRFNKTIYQYEKNILNDKQYGADSQDIIDTIIPLLLKHGIIEERETQQSRQASTKTYRLTKKLEEIFSYDGITEPINELSTFWLYVNSVDDYQSK